MKTKPGDVVFSTAYGHISSWVVLREKDQYDHVRLYKIGCDRYNEVMIDLKEDDLFPSEEEAIKQAILEENEAFERNFKLHNEKLSELFTKLGNVHKEESNDNPD